MYVDSHAHIDGDEYDTDRDEVIERALEAGVCAILNVGTGDPHSGTLERAVEVAEKYEGVYAAVGVHPHDAKLYDEDAENRLLGLVRRGGRILAWGEIGLDYHYDHSPRDVQRAVFADHVALAAERDLPLVVHTREAWDDTFAILGPAPPAPTVFHCFSGGVDEARRALDLGCFLSFSGIVTFANAGDVREAAAICPLDRLLVETDAPFLAPVPHRGRPNAPALLPDVAAGVAAAKKMALDQVERATWATAAEVFCLQ